MAEPKQEYTGSWIPAAVMLSKELRPIEKLLYAEIASFNSCWASNGWLSERIGISERSVTSGIRRLKELNFIVVVETENSRLCTASQNLLPPLEKFATPLAKFAIKNNNKNKEIEKTHTSTLRDDDRVSTSPLPAPTVGDSSAQDSSEEASAARTEHLIRVFTAITRILHPGQSIMFTAGRKSHLNARLKSFKPSEIVEAAKNLMEDPWNTGQNPTNKKYASYDFLMRKDEQVEKWLNEKPVKRHKSVF